MNWDNARHPGNVTKNRAAIFDNVIHNRRETSLVCNVDITEVILLSDAKQMMLTFHVKALKDPISSACMVHVSDCIQKGGENKCPVCPNLDDQ